MIAHYLYTVFRALSGERLWSRDLALEYKKHADEAVDSLNADAAALRSAVQIARRERDEIRTRYETLVAECTRHRHATWEITHK